MQLIKTIVCIIEQEATKQESRREEMFVKHHPLHALGCVSQFHTIYLDELSWLACYLHF